MARFSYLARGDGCALIFLHGVGGDAGCWRPQLEAFGSGFRAIAWDMPGYGGSAPLPEMTFPALARALADLLDELAVAGAHLVGHSMGGMVAQEFVATWPGRVRSLSLCATSAAFGQPDGAWQEAFVEQRLKPLDRGRSMADLAPEMVRSLTGAGADPAGLAQAALSFARVPADTYRQAIRCLAGFDRRAALPRIPVPTLLIAGERDQASPAALMRRVAGRIPGAGLVVLPGAGHLVNLEQPEAFNRALGNFLASQPVAPEAGDLSAGEG